MKKFAVLLGSLVLAAAFFTAPAAIAASVDNTVKIATKQQAVPESQNIIYADRVIQLVNKERRNRGLQEYKMIPKLTKCAVIRVKETTVYWSHQRTNGTSGMDVIDEVGLSWTGKAENIAVGQNTPESVVNSWMNSAGHRSNILSSDYKYIGVGCVCYNGQYYWVQEFLASRENFDYAFLPEKHGEINDSGVVDAVDASIVLAEYASVSAGKGSILSRSQRARAEINGDDIVDAADASMILNIYSFNSSR
ncbi:CAP domain-containing protein [Ruminococcus sp.]|uniref:CAP domain-containing protein n=1 Tax=Ruminococcus sp. TaxID=41978 RepID=UPI0025D99330|nr:CAP domain-containing protein [Ruminococcus sp.]